MGALDELRDRAAGVAAPEAVLALYREAFARYGVRALWSLRRDIERPTVLQALMVAEALRVEGDVAARALAAQIEEGCRAAV